MKKYTLTIFSGGAIPERFGSYTFRPDITLYQSSTPNSIGKKFPQFFALDMKKVSLYLLPGKILLKYLSVDNITVPIFGYNQRNQDFIRYINRLIDEKPGNIDILLIKHLLFVFYGMCESIESVIDSLIYLRSNIEYLTQKCIYYNQQNKIDNIYGGFNVDESGSINKINYFLQKIEEFMEENPEITIHPSRVTERTFDILLVNLLKEHNLCNGYYYDDDETSEEIYLLNYIIKGAKLIVPSELCLLHGTHNLNLINE